MSEESASHEEDELDLAELGDEDNSVEEEDLEGLEDDSLANEGDELELSELGQEESAPEGEELDLAGLTDDSLAATEDTAPVSEESASHEEDELDLAELGEEDNSDEEEDLDLAGLEGDSPKSEGEDLALAGLEENGESPDEEDLDLADLESGLEEVEDSETDLNPTRSEEAQSEALPEDIDLEDKEDEGGFEGEILSSADEAPTLGDEGDLLDADLSALESDDPSLDLESEESKPPLSPSAGPDQLEADSLPVLPELEGDDSLLDEDLAALEDPLLGLESSGSELPGGPLATPEADEELLDHLETDLQDMKEEEGFDKGELPPKETASPAGLGEEGSDRETPLTEIEALDSKDELGLEDLEEGGDIDESENLEDALLEGIPEDDPEPLADLEESEDLNLPSPKDEAMSADQQEDSNLTGEEGHLPAIDPMDQDILPKGPEIEDDLLGQDLQAMNDPEVGAPTKNDVLKQLSTAQVELNRALMRLSLLSSKDKILKETGGAIKCVFKAAFLVKSGKKDSTPLMAIGTSDLAPKELVKKASSLSRDKWTAMGNGKARLLASESSEYLFYGEFHQEDLDREEILKTADHLLRSSLRYWEKVAEGG